MGMAMTKSERYFVFPEEWAFLSIDDDRISTGELARLAKAVARELHRRDSSEYIADKMRDSLKATGSMASEDVGKNADWGLTGAPEDDGASKLGALILLCQDLGFDYLELDNVAGRARGCIERDQALRERDEARAAGVEYAKRTDEQIEHLASQIGKLEAERDAARAEAAEARAVAYALYHANSDDSAPVGWALAKAQQWAPKGGGDGRAE